MYYQTFDFYKDTMWEIFRFCSGAVVARQQTRHYDFELRLRLWCLCESQTLMQVNTLKLIERGNCTGMILRNLWHRLQSEIGALLRYNMDTFQKKDAEHKCFCSVELQLQAPFQVWMKSLIYGSQVYSGRNSYCRNFNETSLQNTRLFCWYKQLCHLWRQWWCVLS